MTPRGYEHRQSPKAMFYANKAFVIRMSYSKRTALDANRGVCGVPAACGGVERLGVPGALAALQKAVWGSGMYAHPIVVFFVKSSSVWRVCFGIHILLLI